MYTVSALLPAAYIIGLTFTLKTHSHIYDINVGEGQGTFLPLRNHSSRSVRAGGGGGRSTPPSLSQRRETTERWSTGRGGGPSSSSSWPPCSRLPALIWSQSTFSLSSTSPTSHRSEQSSEHAQTAVSVSWNQTNLQVRLLQYFIGVTVLAMVSEIPEIVNGIQFALHNNISLR